MFGIFKSIPLEYRDNLLTYLNSDCYVIKDIQIEPFSYSINTPLEIRFVKEGSVYFIQSVKYSIFDIDINFKDDEFVNPYIELSIVDKKYYITLIFDQLSKISFECFDFDIKKIEK